MSRKACGNPLVARHQTSLEFIQSLFFSLAMWQEAKTGSSSTCSLSSCSLWRRTTARISENRPHLQPTGWPHLDQVSVLWPSSQPWHTGPRAWTRGAGTGRRNPPGSCWSRSCATNHLERRADGQPIRATCRKLLKSCSSSHLLFLLLKTDSVRSVSRSLSSISSRFLPAFQKSRVFSMMLSPPALLAWSRKWQNFKWECNSPFLVAHYFCNVGVLEQQQIHEKL